MKGMGYEKKKMAERILNHALGIIYLLTGEEYVIVKKKTPHSSIHLVTGEVPIKCGDVSVYFSMEEWDYIEAHKDIYTEMMIEDHQLHSKKEIPTKQKPGTDAKSVNSSESEKRVQKGTCAKTVDSSERENRLQKEVVNEKIETILISEEGECDSDEEDIQVVEIDPDNCAGHQEDPNTISNRDNQASRRAEQDIESLDIAADTGRDGPMSKKVSEESHVAEFIQEDGTVQPSGFQENFGGMPSNLLDSLQIRNVTSTYRSYKSEQAIRALNKTVTSDRIEVPLKTKHAVSGCAKSSTGMLASADRPVSALGKPYACNDCGKDFDYKSNLIKHQRAHAVEKPLGRNESMVQSGTKPIFSVYQRTNSSRKRHRCNLCGKQFTYKSQFTTHLRTHTGEKPHSCNQCGKRFAYKSYLITHQRIHSGERPHICTHCGRCFTDKSNLRKHQSTHSEERPYTCLKCGKHFYSKYNFTAHQRLHMERPSQDN